LLDFLLNEIGKNESKYADDGKTNYLRVNVLTICFALKIYDAVSLYLK